MYFKTLAGGTIAMAASVGMLTAGGGGAYSGSVSGGKGMVGSAGGALGSLTGGAADTAGCIGCPFEAFGSTLENALTPIWSLADLYEGDGFLQNFGIHGRYQGQYYWADGTDGTDDDYETRRSRLGLHFGLANGLEFETTWNIELDDGLELDNLYTSGISWEGENGYKFGVGKLKPGITAEWNTSSKRILTFERSLLVNQILPTPTGSVYVGGTASGIDWDLWAMTGGTEGQYDLPSLDGGLNYMARFSTALSDNVTGHLHYLRHEADADNVNLEPFDNIVSLGQTTKTEAGGLITDLIYATGDGETSDAYGVVIMPYYDVTDRIRLVLRGQYAASDASDGLRLQRRYERTVADDDAQRGDSYWAVYGGINYYIMGDSLKLMTGIEYSDLSGSSNFDGFTGFTGIRLDF